MSYLDRIYTKWIYILEDIMAYFLPTKECKSYEKKSEMTAKYDGRITEEHNQKVCVFFILKNMQILEK